ncbi:4,4'-diaponeurosporenoate glycosyltransferase [Chlamydia abortus]|uniref:Glycosyltransferase family 2 protein n=1 Tax=Paenibacillus residui TaxID=629724 RepID=A0ABW3DBB6_9BACL|nr:glycosyltransferase family 2 protein [Aneurinibacillus sp. XH2]SHE10517.1 4,4'-diaponeurosporenoate glycosyltransferase [Chlamydia abortus]
MKTLIIIPAYNEEKSIVQVLASVKQNHPAADIVVVNDGSKDQTGALARSTGLAHVIDLPVNVGIGGAVQTGYLFAYRHGYEVAVQIDADGQHNPADVDKIVKVIESGEADCCVGSRFLQKTAYRSSWSRRTGIRFFAWLIRGVTGKTITDPTSGFRAVNRRVIELFAEYYPDDYPEVEAVVLLERKGFRVREASVLMNERTSGKSSITPLKSLYYMLKVSLAVLMTRIRNVS